MLDLIKKSMRAKLSLAMVLVTASLLLVVVSGNILTQNLESGLRTFGGNYLPSISTILNADRDLYQARVAQMNYLLGQDKSSSLKDFEENAQQAFDRMQKYRDLMSDYPEILSKLDQFDSTFTTWKSSSIQVFSLMDNGNNTEALSLSNNQNNADFSNLRQLYDAAGEQLDNQASAKNVQLSEEISTYQFWIMAFVLIVVIGACTTSYLTPKILVESINDLTGRIKEISEGDGDLTLRINSARIDELGHLASAFDGFVGKLDYLIKGVRKNTDELYQGSKVLQDSSQKSQSITNSQSEGVDMIATAVNEFSAAIREVAQNSQNTANETSDTVDLTQQGVTVIEKSVVQIQDLSSSILNASEVIEKLATESENIASVLDVIRGIAEQTNLLALNAAIEAARAGEQGRGFAVVADEVRSLASKTQHSTEEIQNMIERLQNGVKEAVISIQDGSDKVQSNVDLANNTQELLNQIQSSAAKVSDMATQIAAATEEQSLVTEEINMNLTNLNDQNQESREIANQNLQISDSVSALSNKLTEDVQQFKVS